MIKQDLTPWKPNHAALNNYEEDYSGNKIGCYELYTGDDKSSPPLVLTNMARLSCVKANKAIKKAMNHVKK